MEWKMHFNKTSMMKLKLWRNHLDDWIKLNWIKVDRAVCSVMGFNKGICIFRPLVLCLAPVPESQFAFNSPGPQFVFTGPGPRFAYLLALPSNLLFTSSGQDFTTTTTATCTITTPAITTNEKVKSYFSKFVSVMATFPRTGKQQLLKQLAAGCFWNKFG